MLATETSGESIPSLRQMNNRGPLEAIASVCEDDQEDLMAIAGLSDETYRNM